jgi:hypothetical protein
MTNSSTKQIFILNSTNYPNWKSCMLLKLEINDLLDAISGPKYADRKTDLKAHSIILESIDPSLDNIVNSEKSAYNMWVKLDQQFNSVTMTSAMELFTEFITMKLRDNESIADYYNRSVDNYRQLSQLNYTMDDYQLIVFLCGLPAIYEPTVSTILQKDIKDWNILKLRSTLMEAQQRMKSYENNEDYASAYKAKKKYLCKFCQKDNY